MSTEADGGGKETNMEHDNSKNTRGVTKRTSAPTDTFNPTKHSDRLSVASVGGRNKINSEKLN